MSQPMEISFGETYLFHSQYRWLLGELSLCHRVNRDSFWRDITVSQQIENSLGEI